MAVTASEPHAQERVAYLSFGLGRHDVEGPSGTTNFVTYPSPPGGTVNSWILGGGASVSGLVSLDGEISKTGTMYARQPSRYFTVNEERRELVLSGGVRFHFPVNEQVTFEPVGGLLFISSSGFQQLEYDPPVSIVHRDGPRTPSQPDVRFGVAGGLDVRIGGKHVAGVPSLRVFRAFGGYGPSGGPQWQLAVRP